jgi:glycosyltransferase involved in cell wall biosynthesis
VKVSLVMPTYNRTQYTPIAIRCFTQQTYPNVELVIVDDSTEGTMVIPSDGRIRYIRLEQRTPTGTKRNIGAEAADGEIIANLDDDDWSSAHRIEDQVQRLLKTGKAVTGYNATVVYDEQTGNLYKNCGGPPYFASGTSQMYTKAWWREHPYPDCSYGEDSVFARAARLANQLSIADPGRMLIARKHANNTDEVVLRRLQKLALDDAPWEFYRAINTVRPSLDYIWQAHECSRDCLAEVVRQMNSPIIDADYKATRLPEVQTR